jgi:hypothetical protein
MDWIDLAQDRNRGRVVLNAVKNPDSNKYGEFFEYLSANYLIRTLFHGAGIGSLKIQLFLIFVDPCIIVYFTLKSSKKQQCIKILFQIYMKLNMFRGHTAYHQEPKTALRASGFAYVVGCWPCSLMDAVS